MKHRLMWVACLILLLGIVACVQDNPLSPPDEQFGIDKANGNPGVIPPNARVHGKTYAEWSAAWWQWLWSAPVDVNPGLDETGEFVTWGQSGPVWFIAPNYGGVSERWATIPPERHFSSTFCHGSFLRLSEIPKTRRRSALRQPPRWKLQNWSLLLSTVYRCRTRKRTACNPISSASRFPRTTCSRCSDTLLNPELTIPG